MDVSYGQANELLLGQELEQVVELKHHRFASEYSPLLGYRGDLDLAYRYCATSISGSSVQRRAVLAPGRPGDEVRACGEQHSAGESRLRLSGTAPQFAPNATFVTDIPRLSVV